MENKIYKSSLPESKSSEIYIQQISHNVDEKTGFLMAELQAGNLPRVNGRIKVLDCGVGGGEFVEYFKNEYKDPSVDMIAFDIVHKYVQRATSMTPGVEGVVGDAYEFPFKQNSLSAINLSAVLHEILSYGYQEEKCTSQDAIRELFTKLSQSLVHGGVILYRDVYLPDNHQDYRGANYNTHLAKFITQYGELISKHTQQVFNTELPTILAEDTNMVSVSGNIHYHRELQRHFVTFTDFLCISLGQGSLRSVLNNKESLETIFEEGFSDERLLYDWGKREGSETYTYASIGEIVDIVDTIKSDGQSTLVVDKIETPERTEYTHLISQYTDYVIPDKKQIMLIRKNKP